MDAAGTTEFMRKEQSVLALKIKEQSIGDYKQKLINLKMEWDKVNKYKIELQQKDQYLQDIIDNNINSAKELSEREGNIKLREEAISKQLTDSHKVDQDELVSIKARIKEEKDNSINNITKQFDDIKMNLNNKQQKNSNVITELENLVEEKTNTISELESSLVSLKDLEKQLEGKNKRISDLENNNLPIGLKIP